MLRTRVRIPNSLPSVCHAARIQEDVPSRLKWEVDTRLPAAAVKGLAGSGAPLPHRLTFFGLKVEHQADVLAEFIGPFLLRPDLVEQLEDGFLAVLHLILFRLQVLHNFQSSSAQESPHEGALVLCRQLVHGAHLVDAPELPSPVLAIVPVISREVPRAWSAL